MKKILEKKNDPLKGGQVKLATFVHFFLDLKNEDRIRGNGEMCEPKSGNQGLQAPVCACINHRTILTLHPTQWRLLYLHPSPQTCLH